MDNDLEMKKEEYLLAKQLQDIKRNPVTEGMLSLVKMVPVLGDMMDATITNSLDSFQANKEKELLEVILIGSETITSDKVNDIEFIVNYARTIDAVRRLATNDKVKYFGNLIRNGYLRNYKIESFSFDEYFEILSSMSMREIDYLVQYKLYCEETVKPGKKVRYDKYQYFISDFCGKTGISRGEVDMVFSRLVRTGFVETMLETETADVDDTSIPALAVEGSGYYITKGFHDFYEVVLNSVI